MRRAFPILTTVALLAALVVPASAEGGLTVLRSDADVLELEWTWSAPELEGIPTLDGPTRRPALPGGRHLAGPGQPDVPSIVELIGIPRGPALPRVSVGAVETGVLALPDMTPGRREEFAEEGEGAGVPTLTRSRRADPFEAGISPAGWAELLGTTDLRGQRAAQLAIHPFRYDADRSELIWARRLVVRIEFPRGEEAGPGRPDRPRWEEALDAALLNAPAARRWRAVSAPAARGGPADSFESSPNWLRFPITEAGVYRLDYFTFSNLGVDPGSIDPRTIRVFAGTSLPLEESLATPPPTFMTECALKPVGSSDLDDVFDTSDRFLFYALSPHGWANEYDPSRSRTDYVENKYTDASVYWVTWGGSFSGAARRMGTRSVAPAAADSVFATSAPWRTHYEENNSENFRYRDEDGWAWEDLRGRGTDRLYQLRVRQPASGDGVLTARLMSHIASGFNLRTIELKIATPDVATYWEWCHSSNSAIYDVTACFDNLLFDGLVPVRVNANTGNPAAIDNVFTAWFDLEYDRRLHAADGRYLKFLADPVMPALPSPPNINFCASATPDSAGICPNPPANLVYGETAFEISGLDAALADIHLFDVTDQHGIVELTNWALADSVNGAAPWSVRFADPGQPGTRWYVAVTMNGVRQLSGGSQATLRGLRSSSNGADYVVIYHPRFEAGAQRLASIRANVPGDALATMAVSADDVYQEFGWGMRDPVAIRDFLAWTLGDAGLGGWEGGAPIFAAFIGDAAYDTKGYLSGSPVDYLSTYTERYRTGGAQYIQGQNLTFYSTDDFFGYLRADDYTTSSTIPGLDIAIGRFPVKTERELDLMLDKLETYVGYASPGQWQNRVILVADDERVLSDNIREPVHTQQVENIAEVWFPPAIDAVKVYLTEYPRDPFGKKPEAQDAFIEEFTRGALHTSYTGHGDQSTMAQEEVFVSQKVSELFNEDRYTVFSTFSCTVSRFDLLSGDSMTELLIKHPEGGAVTTFASGGLVFPGPSFGLNQEWLSGMYGTPYLIETTARTVRPIGQAALLAKAIMNTNTTVLQNSEKYVLLGDPALRTRFGRAVIRFEPATVDSQATEGLLRRVDGYVIHEDGSILDGSGGHPPFNGTAWVHVTELADSSGYDYTGPPPFNTPGHIDYVLDGPTAFRGQVPVSNGRFSVRFFLSEAVLSGNSARISVFGLEDAEDRRDASGAYDALVIAPTISPSQVQDAQGPRVTIRFEGYDRFVDGDFIFTDKPVLTIELEDESGINLRPFPQFARLEAEVDGRDRIDLADDFSYDEGDFTQGQVRRILPLAPGKHTLEVKAFDNVNNRGSARVEFEIVLADTEFDLVDEHIAVYPNPFRSRADFLLRLTQDAEVDLAVFTITGRRIWETTLAGVAGDNVISWDGRDENGTPLANGTYLFKVKARSTDSEGNAASDEYVGKVVRMQ